VGAAVDLAERSSRGPGVVGRDELVRVAGRALCTDRLFEVVRHGHSLTWTDAFWMAVGRAERSTAVDVRTASG